MRRSINYIIQSQYADEQMKEARKQHICPICRKEMKKELIHTLTLKCEECRLEIIYD